MKNLSPIRDLALFSAAITIALIALVAVFAQPEPTPGIAISATSSTTTATIVSPEVTPDPVTPEIFVYDPTNGIRQEFEVYAVDQGPDDMSQPGRIPINGVRLRAEIMASSGHPTPHAYLMSPSTGGVNPVNGQVHDAMFFQHHGTNPFVDADEDSLLTFGLDVDTASYTITRRFLLEGTMPPEEAVRVEEFLNFFNWNMAPPEESDFAIHVDGAPSRFGGDNRHLLRIGIRGREVASADRPDANLTFVIDTSGSMAAENRLGLVKRALRLLVNELRPSDQVAIVEYGTRGRIIMEHTPVRDRLEILDAIDRLQTNGSTNAEEGLMLGYGEAARVFNPDKINHVILCSDGVANVGATGADGILERIRREADEGITLTTVGFGMDNFNDVLMERLADEGDGSYAYVDTISEARRIFVENATGTLQIIAREARAQVDFNPDVVRSYRLLGYENRDIEDDRFRDDTVDAGEIGAGHRVTVLVEVRLWDEPEDGRLGTVNLRWGEPNSDRFTEIAEPITLDDLAPSFDEASAEFRLAACVAETAEVLRGSYWAQESDLDEVLAEAQSALADLRSDDTSIVEFLSVLAHARDLQNRDVAPGTGG